MGKIAVIQFPGSNSEREVFLALSRVGLEAHPIMWNTSIDDWHDYEGYILVGGFAYEDRSRAGVIASHHPIMNKLKIESQKGKLILGICNGAQILVESGMIPGTDNGEVSMALSQNKRILNHKIIGTGYYNTWCYIKSVVPKNRCAFVVDIAKNDYFKIPTAHAEGRFLITPPLLKKLYDNEQIVFRYADKHGVIDENFPTNPNGSVDNIAAICNPMGNVMAIMPHPERSINGNAIFSSMKTHIDNSLKFNKPPKLSHNNERYKLLPYPHQKNHKNYIIESITTDNVLLSVANALKQEGYNWQINRYIHWELAFKTQPSKNQLNTLLSSYELFNPAKESVVPSLKKSNDAINILVRIKDDDKSDSILQHLQKFYGFDNLLSIKGSILWRFQNIKSYDEIYKYFQNANLFFNPIAHQCYVI